MKENGALLQAGLLSSAVGAPRARGAAQRARMERAWTLERAWSVHQRRPS